MIKLPKLNKLNWKKILRELDLSDYPSLPEKLKDMRKKILNKSSLSVLEDTVGFALFNKYFEEYSNEINSNYIRTINYNKFKKLPPLEHQKEGVEFLLKNDRCILADTMGKGKTLTSIYASLLMDDSAKILVVSTNSLKYNFAKELSRLTDNYCVIDKKWKVVNEKFVFIHYDGVKKYINEIDKFNPDIIICDEVHEVKNMKSAKAKSMFDVLSVTKPKKLWLLTGTPIANRPLEFFTILRMLKHPLAKNWETYITRYCNGQKDYFGRWITKGSSNLKELHELTKPIILRRTNKKGDLPPFEREKRIIEMDDKLMEEYLNCVQEFEKVKKEELQIELNELGLGSFANRYSANEVTKIVVNRIFCARAKLENQYLTKIINDELSKDPSAKIIVFTNYIDVVDKIQEKYGKICLKLDGRVKEAKERQNIVDKFNDNDEYKVFVTNLKVGGTGYNIQSANIIIVNDMDWVPNTMLQAECRAWRFGQKRSVKAIYPIFKNTIEEVLFEIVNTKMQIITELIDGEVEEYFDDGNDSKKDVQSTFEELTKEDILKEIFAQMKF